MSKKKAKQESYRESIIKYKLNKDYCLFICKDDCDLALDNDGNIVAFCSVPLKNKGKPCKDYQELENYTNFLNHTLSMIKKDRRKSVMRFKRKVIEFIDRCIEAISGGHYKNKLTTKETYDYTVTVLKTIRNTISDNL